MGPGVEIIYVMYLLNFYVYEYNTCHYNKKFTYLLTYLLTYILNTVLHQNLNSRTRHLIGCDRKS